MSARSEEVPHGGLLVAMLGSPSAADVEQAVSRAESAVPVTLLSVVARPPEVQARLRVPKIDRPLIELLVQAREEWLEGLAGTLPFEVVIRTFCGGEVRTIIEEAVSGNYEQVVAVSDSSDRARLLVARLIELCPTPLFVVPPGRVGLRANVVAAVDPDSDPDLNTAIIGAAARAATNNGGALHLVHAWQLAGEDDLLRSEGLTIGGPEVAAFAEVVQSAHQRAFDDLVETIAMPVVAAAGGPPLQRHLIQGSIRDAVRRVKDLEKVGLVVIGTEGRAAIESALGGSNARQVADADGYATLILKPDNFVSPLT